MNIQEAKETIENALRAYFARDEIGFPLVPLRQQRPILHELHFKGSRNQRIIDCKKSLETGSVVIKEL